MEQGNLTYEGKHFSSPEEELQYLRQVIAGKEQAALSIGEKKDREALIAQELSSYSSQQVDRVLHEHYKIPDQEKREIVLELTPEPHDKKIEELLAILYERGVLNAISVARAMNNPHIDDDFHRFLVEYIKKG